MQGALMGILIAILVISAVAGVVALVLAFVRQRAGEPIRVPLRVLLRVYLYVVVIAGMVITTQGASSLVRAGLGAAIDKQFSYEPVYVPIAAPPVEEKGEARPSGPTPQELEARNKGLDRAMKEGLINGVTLSIIGVLVLGVHWVGLQFLERAEERAGTLRRLFLFSTLAVFTVVVLISLPQALFESARYWLLEPVDQYSRYGVPGEELATAIVALPVWVVFLVWTLALARRHTNGIT